MIYAKEFFDLQFEFAQTAAVLSGLPLERVLLEYTMADCTHLMELR